MNTQSDSSYSNCELIEANIFNERCIILNSIIEFFENTETGDSELDWIKTNETIILGDRLIEPKTINKTIYNRKTLYYNVLIEIWGNSATKDYSIGWKRLPETYEIVEEF